MQFFSPLALLVQAVLLKRGLGNASASLMHSVQHNSHFEQLCAIVPPRRPTGHRGLRPVEEELEDQRNLGKGSDPRAPGACRAGTHTCSACCCLEDMVGGKRRGRYSFPSRQGGLVSRGRPASAQPFPSHCPRCSAAERHVGPGRAGSFTSLPSLPHPSQQSRMTNEGFMCQLCTVAPVAWSA